MEKNCICINDKNYPNEIPVYKRPKLNEPYTIIKIDKLLMHGGIMGVQLAEIDLSDCEPFSYFAASRFAPLAPKEEIKEEELEEITI